MIRLHLNSEVVVCDVDVVKPEMHCNWGSKLTVKIGHFCLFLRVVLC